MNTEQLCFNLAEIEGTSGNESKVAEFISPILEKFGLEVRIDPLGNLLASNNGEGKRILIAAHMDQVGLIIRGIDDKGFLLFDKIGGTDLRILTGAEVIVHGKEDLFGVICSTPPHLLTPEDKKAGVDIKKLAIDIGFNKHESEKLVSPGDRVTIRNTQAKLLNGNICSSAFDDRSCVAVVIKAIEKVNENINNINLNLLFSVQEEVGLVGAQTGAFNIMPDEAIVVDVGFGDDPYTDKTLTIAINGGPSIGISPILDKKLTDELIEICKKNDISFQHDVMSGRTGTDADKITINASGVKTALISLPLRYMHTANEVINVNDVDATAELISKYLLEKEAE